MKSRHFTVEAQLIAPERVTARLAAPLRNLWVLLVGVVLLLPSPVAAQLSEDQAVLLADARTAFERRLGWQTYQQSRQATTAIATTFSNPEEQTWSTYTHSQHSTGLYSLPDQRSDGTLQLEQRRADSTGTQENTQTGLVFQTLGTNLLIGETIDELQPFTASDYPLLEPAYLTAVHPYPLELLDFTLAIYDLGVRRQIQAYDIELDPAALTIDLEDVLGTYLAQYPELEAALLANSTLTLTVQIDRASDQLISLTFNLATQADIETNEGYFSLTYGFTDSLSYSDVES